MIWVLLGALILGLLVAAFVIRQRANDIEEVILQGRPVLLRCAKRRIENRTDDSALENQAEGSC